MATIAQPVNKNPLFNVENRIVQYEFESPFEAEYVLLTPTHIHISSNAPYQLAKTGDILFDKDSWWSVRKRAVVGKSIWKLCWHFQYYRNPPPIIEALRLLYF